MPSARFDKLDPARQEAILAAAADEFVAHGYAAASVNRIVERAGTSKGALYYYFESKADLLGTVVERAVRRVMGAAEWPALEDFTAADYWERIRDLTLRSVASMQSDTWYMRLMWAFYRLRDEPAAQEATAGVLDWSRRFTHAFLARGQELGQVRTDVPLDLLVEMFRAADEAGDRWMAQRWSGMSEPEQRALLEARLDLARDMVDARHMGWGR